MNVWTVEVTDTFGDEANYSWCRRYTVKAPESASRNSVLRRARRVAGVHGKARRVDDMGDCYAVWNPGGDCIVMFVVYHHTDAPTTDPAWVRGIEWPGQGHGGCIRVRAALGPPAVTSQLTTEL